MPRPDPGLIGPERATPADIDGLNRLFADAFTDRYHRDGMPGVRVPPLSPAVWRYAIEDAGDGALVWRDAAGQLAAFNLVRLSGTEGWMGPLAVRPALQGRGGGRQIVEAGIGWLRSRGARCIGLETMPRTVENIGFYSRLGFVPGHLTISLGRDLPPPGAEPVGERLSEAADRTALLAGCRELLGELAPGVEYAREIELTAELGLGDTTVLGDGQGVRAFALWHNAPLAAGRLADEVRVLKVAARDLEAYLALLDGITADAAARAIASRITVRCQTAHAAAYAALAVRGWQVLWTDLRMTLLGAGETGRTGIVMSNWEI